MTYNKPLMDKILDQITQHPETHNQGSFANRDACGTTYCVAGWACVLSGVELGFQTFETYEYADSTVDGESIVDKAEQLLGISPTESYRLFIGAQTMRGIKSAVKRIEAAHVADTLV